MMNRNSGVLRVAIATVVGVASIAAMWVWLARTVQAPMSSKQLRSVAQPELAKKQAPVVAPKGPAVSGAAGNNAGPFDYRKAFAEAHDYWEFAHRALPAAKAGNADAQFYLSRVLERCDQDNRMYFQRKGQKIGLDEGLQYAVKRHLSMEVAQSVYEKCHEFQESDVADLGAAADWLAKATAAGQPLAETTTASKLLIQEVLQNSARAGGVPNPNANSRIEGGSDPHSLFRAAVESKDPEILFDIGEAQGMLYPASKDVNARRFAWLLVACQRGFDCSESADWVKNSCGDDADCTSASSPSERVRRLTGDQWPEVQQRAQEISAKLDTGRWDELDLGPNEP